MKKKVIYIGNDINLKNRICKILSIENDDILTLGINDEFLGRVNFKAHVSETKPVYIV